MKKKRLLFNYLPWLLGAALCMPLVGCSSDDDDDEPERFIKTFTFDHFKQEGCYLLGYPDKTWSCWNNWGKKGASFSVYMVQNGIIYDAGVVHSNDTIITEEEKGKKNLPFDVEIPSTINKDAAFDVLAVCYTESSLSGGNIECKVDLKRSGTMPLWDNPQPSSMQTDGKCYSLSTIELLNIHNTSSDSVTIKQKGFDVKDKWYYSKAKVVLTADKKVNGYGSSVDEEVASNEYKVAPGDTVKIWSFYVPTGKKMKDARLILEINGKEVKTQPISSDVDIELGQFYAMAVQWDGKSLNWKPNKKATRSLKGNARVGNPIIMTGDSPSSDF